MNNDFMLHDPASILLGIYNSLFIKGSNLPMVYVFLHQKNRVAYQCPLVVLIAVEYNMFTGSVMFDL